MEDKDTSRNYSEELAEEILKNHITIATLEAFAKKEGCTIAEAMDGRLYERLQEMVSARVDVDSWPSFAELPDNFPKKLRDTEEVFSAAFDIGVKGWELGYLAGFADRGALG